MWIFKVQSRKSCSEHMDLNLVTSARGLGLQVWREGLMCSYEPPHIISSSKLGQETFTAVLYWETWGCPAHSELCSEDRQGGWASNMHSTYEKISQAKGQ